MRKGPEENFVPTLLVSFTVSWLLVWSMKANGYAHEHNFAWSLLSFVRWLLTVGVIGWLLVLLLPDYFESRKKEDQLRKTAHEELINSEVQRRLRVIRDREWKQKESERRHEERKKETERRRKQLEARRQEEYKNKLKEELLKTRSADDATQEAFSDFV